MGIPRQDQIDGALVEALAWTIRSGLRHRTRVRDLVEGKMAVDVETVVARAIYMLTGYSGPRTGDPGLAALAKVVGARVAKRLTDDRHWWVGGWRVPRGDARSHVPHEGPMREDGCPVDELDDFGRKTRPYGAMTENDGIRHEDAMEAHASAMDAHDDSMDEEAWQAFLAECDASEG